MTNSIAEIEDADFLLVAGSNTTEAHPVLALRMKKALRRGARLAVVDPRRIWLADHADWHLQLRPGTDVWLFNAMANVAIDEDLVDQRYLDTHTEGFEAVREVVAAYTPERAADATGVDATTIREVARAYATTPRAGIYYTLGITEHVCGVDTVWTLSNLALMTGHVGIPAAGVNPLRGQNNVQGANDMGNNPVYLPGYQDIDDPDARAAFGRAWGRTVPSAPGMRLDEMMAGLHDGRIHAMFIMGEDPLVSEPNLTKVSEGFAGLDFVVCQDLFLTETAAAHADVVLPAAGFAEKDGTFTNSERRVQRVRAALTPRGGSLPDWEILVAVADRLGAGWSYDHPSEVWDEVAGLSPRFAGIHYDRLDGAGIQWPCPDVDHPGTTYLHGDAPLAGTARLFPVEYTPPHESTDSEYPIVLSTGRTLYHYNADTMTGREAGLAAKEGEPFVEIHPDDASLRGIGDGDRCAVESRRGRIEVTARVGSRVRPGCAWMPFHFTSALTNLLTVDAGDAYVGTPEYKVCAAQIARVTS